jgi:hypothetical protein
MARLSRYLCVALTLLLPNHALAWTPLHHHHHKPSRASQSHKIQKLKLNTPSPALLLIQTGILSSLLVVPFSANAAEELTKSMGTPLEFPIVIFAVTGALIIGQREEQKVQQEESAAKLQRKRANQSEVEMRAALQDRIKKQKMSQPIQIQQPPPPQPVQPQPVPVESYDQPSTYASPTPQTTYSKPATSTPTLPREIPQRKPTPEEEAFLRGYAQNHSTD